VNTEQDFDLLIVGGGMVGASLAIALSGQNLRIGVIESFVPGDPGQPSYDDRAIALAYGSRRIFEAMHLWDDLKEDAGAIKQIHVSDRGHFGFTRLKASDENVPALGHVVTARQLGFGLLGRLKQCKDVNVIAPAKVVAVSSDELAASVDVEQNGVVTSYTATLLIAADGGKSFIREQLNIPTQQWEYGQSAVVTNITPTQHHNNVAYERFTDSGPIALLPMADDRCAVVWTLADEQLDEVLAYSDEEFMQAFQKRFGYRLGAFVKVGKRSSYPLSLMRAKESVRQRIAIIGNAAHTLHPIAGQGFNLGIRDVAALVDVVLQAKTSGEDIGSDEVLAQYQDWRSGEQRGMAMATDGLVRIFTNPLRSVQLVRNLALVAMDVFPASKRRLAKAAMGMIGKLPRLGRGVSVDK